MFYVYTSLTHLVTERLLVWLFHSYQQASHNSEVVVDLRLSHMSELCANRTTKAFGYENIMHKYVVSKFACPSCCEPLCSVMQEVIILST